MKKTNAYLSKMQLEVWKMKENVYQATRDMDSKQYFDYLKKAAVGFRKFAVGH